MPNVAQRFANVGEVYGSTGTVWQDPTDIASSVGNLTSTDPTTFKANSADVTLLPGNSSNQLVARNFRLGQGMDKIPDSADIVGIQARIQCKAFRGTNPNVPAPFAAEYEVVQHATGVRALVQVQEHACLAQR